MIHTACLHSLIDQGAHEISRVNPPAIVASGLTDRLAKHVAQSPALDDGLYWYERESMGIMYYGV